MNVRVRLFAGLKEMLRTDVLNLELHGQPTLAAVAAAFFERYPEAASWRNSLMYALNMDFATRDALVHEGDEVAFIPPVSGG